MDEANTHDPGFESEAQRRVKEETNLLRETVMRLEEKVGGLDGVARGLDERMSRLEEENVVLRASNAYLQREVARNSKIISLLPYRQASSVLQPVEVGVRDCNISRWSRCLSSIT
jgi:hypothetical protein